MDFRLKTFYLVILALLAGGFFFTHPVFAATINKSLSSQSSLNNGLMGWWTFDGTDCGTTYCIDKSGNGKTGTSTVAITKTRGKIGQAAKFNGSNYYDVTSAKPFSNATAATISLWAKRSAINALVEIGQFDSNTSRFGFDFYSDGNVYAEVANGANTYGYFASNDTLWHHYVLVYDGTQSGDAGRLKVYMDGVNKSLTFGSPIPASVGNIVSGLTVGYLNPRYTSGSLDDVRIYNRVLTAKEIKMLYQEGVAGKIAQIPPSAPNLNSGLVGWWTFDGADCGATYCIDKSGRSMSGALTGGTASSTKITGKIGQALKMNGINNWVDIGVTAKPSALNLTGNMTITAWIYSQSSAYAGIVMDMTSLANSSQFSLELNRTANKFSALASGASVALTSNTAISLNKWYHVALTRSGTAGAWTYTIYLNGANDGQATTAVDPNVQAGAAIGRGGNWDSGYFKGKIDDVRIYNRALSAKEIQELYKQGGGKIAQTPPNTPNLNNGLVGWWTFDGVDCGATYCIDKSGRSMSGIMTGGTASSTKVTGKISQALKMNGVNNWVDIGVTAKPSALNLTGNMTITAWIYSQSSTYAAIVMDMTSLANSSQFSLELNRTANKFSALASGASVALTSNTAISLNKWYHVALTRSGTAGAWTYTIYLNGVNDGQATTAVDPNVQAGAAIGRGGNWDSGYFKGKMDDVRIYNRALSAKEVKMLYQMGK